MFDIIISKSKNKYCYSPRGYWAVRLVSLFGVISNIFISTYM